MHITTREKFVSAEKRYDVECKSSGSRPEAMITWWKGSRQIKRMAKNVSIYHCEEDLLLFDIVVNIIREYNMYLYEYFY